MSKRASIDIGTNTILLLILDESGQTIEDHQTVVRLGEGVAQNRAFTVAAMERAYKCLERYKEICDKNGVQSVRAIATSASRDAANSADFFNGVKSKLGFLVEIISGDQEARYSFVGGLLPGQDPLKTVILDIGGGSTEFVTATPGSGKDLVIKGRSVDMGALRATELFLRKDPRTDRYSIDDLTRLETHLRQLWSRGISEDLQEKLRSFEWTGVAGTVTTLAAVMRNLITFDKSKLDGFRMDRCEVADVYESLAVQPVNQLAQNPIIGPGRADVLVAGAAILLTALEEFDRPEIVVSTRGLRYGALLAAKS